MTNKHTVLHISRSIDRSTSAVLTLKAAVLITAIFIIFHQDLAIVASDALQNESTSYILAIPFLLIYLIYRKRKMLRAVIPLETVDPQKQTKHLSTIVGILLSSTAILLYWHGSHTFTPLEYHMLTLPMLAAGLALVLFNLQTFRQLAFPLAFLIFLTPPPSEILRNVGSALSAISSQASYTIIHFLGIPSMLTSEYGNPIIRVTTASGVPLDFSVGIACSGIYSLLGFLVFAVFIAYLIRDKPWKKFALFVIGLGLIYALNITRITAILLIGYNYGQDLAVQLFHLLGGWILIFLGTLLLLTFSEKIFHTRIFSNPQKCPECTAQPAKDHIFCFTCGRILKPPRLRFSKADLVKIGAITTIPILLMPIQAPIFALTQGPQIIVVDTPSGQQVSAEVLPKVPGYDLRFGYRDREFELLAHQDMSLVYYYLPANKSQETVYATIEIASARRNLHDWEICLKEAQAVVNQIDLRDVQLIENPPVIGRFLTFQFVSTNALQAVVYWLEYSKLAMDSTSQQKYVKISLITYPEGLEELPSIEQQTTALAIEVASYWKPIVTWSQIMMLLSQQSLYIAATTATLTLVLTIIYTLERRRGAKANGKAYEKFSTKSRQVIDALMETERTTRPTICEITKAYQDKTGMDIEERDMLQKLTETEKTGMIKSGVANVQDEPTRVWKSHVKLFKNRLIDLTKMTKWLERKRWGIRGKAD